MKPRSNPFLVASLAFVSAATLQAATLYWDGTDTTANADGGAGTWDTVTTNWDDAASGGASVAWPATSSGDDDAVFGVAGGIVTIAPGGVTANDITFDVAGYTVTGGPLTLDGSAPSITNGGATSISANLIGTSGFNKIGNGTLTLTGDNSGLSGNLVISGATSGNNGGVVIGGTDAFGAIGTVDVQSGSFLQLNGATLGASVPITIAGGGGLSAPQGAVRGGSGVSVVNGPITIVDALARLGNVGTSTTFNGPITSSVDSGFGILIRIGSNQGIIFTNTSNYWEGQTNIHEGSYFFHPGALPETSNLKVASSGSTWFETSGTFTRPVGTGAGQIQFNATSGRVNGFSARGGPLTVNIGGSVTPSTLVWGVDDFIPAALGLGGTNSDNTVTLLNPIDLNGANRTINSTNGSAEIDGEISSVISGAAGSILTKTGTGVLLLSNANTHPGGTVIAGSQSAANPLRISNAQAAGTGSLTVGSGGNQDRSSLELTGGITISNAIPAITSRNNTFPHIVNVSENNTMSANLSSGGGGVWLTLQSDDGKLTISGNCSAGRSLGLTGEGEGEISGNVTISNDTTTRLLNKTGGGKWTIGGNMTNSTGTTIAEGTLQIGNGGATGSLGVAPIIIDGELIFDRTGEVSIPGAISGSGIITKRGSSAITLSGATLAYTGDTSIEDGALLITGDATDATGEVTVGDGIGVPATAILGGTGIIGGNITVASDGAIAPGTSAGDLLVKGNVSGNGSLQIEIDDAIADSLTLEGGTLDISNLKLDVSVLNNPTETDYIIVNADSPITGAAFAAVSGLPAGYSVVYGYDDGSDTHNIALVGVPVSNPFETWATTTNGLAGDDALPGADPDNDGLDNLIEFVIGGQPNPANPNADSSGLAPTVGMDANNLIFTFRRTDLALTQPGIVIAVEYGSDLSGWATATDGEDGVAIAVSDLEAGVKQVQVSIPKALAPGQKLFARLKAVIP